MRLVTKRPRGQCTARASSILPHSSDRSAVAVALTDRGQRVDLCANCRDTLKAKELASKRGDSELSELRAWIWRELLRSPMPFPSPKMHRAA